MKAISTKYIRCVKIIYLTTIDNLWQDSTIARSGLIMSLSRIYHKRQGHPRIKGLFPLFSISYLPIYDRSHAVTVGPQAQWPGILDAKYTKANMNAETPCKCSSFVCSTSLFENFREKIMPVNQW